MKTKTWKWKILVLNLMAVLSMWNLCDIAYAAAENYTTVTVNAIDDESGVFRYAIDATDESCWQESNVFYVQPGTTHTIYVKDAAGNITSSEVYAEEIQPVNASAALEEKTETTAAAESGAEIKAGYTYGVGDGVGSVTDYVADGSKEFYTITTTNGNAFYLIIDHRNNDSNVYFTKPVSEMDLLTLAAEAGQINETDLTMAETAETKAIPEKTEEPLPEESEKIKKKGNILTDNLPIFIIIGLLGGGYYYFVIYRKKRDVAAEYDEDAADMDQFIPVEDEDDAALFHYKGNSPDTEENDTDEYLDEFYENNADFEEDTEEEYFNENSADPQEDEPDYTDQNLGLEDDESDGVEV